MIEVRYDEGNRVDEIVASDCWVHLERLSGSQWSLIIETAHSRSHFTIAKKSARVETHVYEIDGAGGRPTRLQRALDHVLPFVNVDIRDKALQIARGEDQPGEAR